MKEWFDPEKHQMQISIIDATEHLLDSTGFEAISVAQICKAAKISRSTFYYHFKDKFDIVQWHFNYVAEHLLFETGRTLTWYQANYLNTCEVVKRKKLYCGAFECRGYQSLFSYAKRRRIETLKETIVDYRNMPLDEELVFQIECLVEAEVAAVARWFKNGMPYSIERFAQLLDDIIPRRLYNLLNDPIHPAMP